MYKLSQISSSRKATKKGFWRECERESTCSLLYCWVWRKINTDYADNLLRIGRFAHLRVVVTTNKNMVLRRQTAVRIGSILEKFRQICENNFWRSSWRTTDKGVLKFGGTNETALSEVPMKLRYRFTYEFRNLFIVKDLVYSYVW